MTKQELIVLFPAFSPKRAIRKLDEGEEVPFEVVGKWVRVARMSDGTWDAFLCNVKDMAKGMGTKRLNLLLATLPNGTKPKVVDGEAWWQCHDVAVVRGWLELHRVSLGIAKRVEVSDAAREAASSRLKSLKMARSEA